MMQYFYSYIFFVFHTLNLMQLKLKYPLNQAFSNTNIDSCINKFINGGEVKIFKMLPLPELILHEVIQNYLILSAIFYRLRNTYNLY